MLPATSKILMTKKSYATAQPPEMRELESVRNWFTSRGEDEQCKGIAADTINKLRVPANPVSAAGSV